jgi:hypothetical protein
VNRNQIEDVVTLLKAQHPDVCVGKVPVLFSPDQVRKVLIEVSKEQPTEKKRFRIEYDDGRNSKSDKNRGPQCTRKDRPMGMYAVSPDGTERPINIGFMRVGEIAGLEKLLNEL